MLENLTVPELITSATAASLLLLFWKSLAGMEQNVDNYSNDCKNRDKIKALFPSWKIQSSTFDSDMPREPESWAFRVSIHCLSSKWVIADYSDLQQKQKQHHRNVALNIEPNMSCQSGKGHVGIVQLNPIERTNLQLPEGDFRVTIPD